MLEQVLKFIGFTPPTAGDILLTLNMIKFIFGRKKSSDLRFGFWGAGAAIRRKKKISSDFPSVQRPFVMMKFILGRKKYSDLRFGFFWGGRSEEKKIFLQIFGGFDVIHQISPLQNPDPKIRRNTCFTPDIRRKFFFLQISPPQIFVSEFRRFW